MRLAITSATLVFLSSSWSIVAADSLPYTAYVAQDRTLVRSGPGDDHYATDRLDRGAEVEVHQRAERGWLAIRPPSTSFSWIAQRDVELADERSIANVLSSSAVSWIGSSVEDVEDHKWLVKLESGEPVSILGKQRRKIVADGKSDLYYKIAPPAGEFRWIHEDDLVQSEPELATQDDEVVLADFRVALRERMRSQAAAAATKQKERARAGVSPEANVPAENVRREDELKKDDFVSRSGAASSNSIPPSKVARLEKRDRPLDAAPLNLEDTTTESRVRELDARLSLLVAQSVEKWDFAQIREDAEEIAARATSTLDRARVQVFLDKVSDFEGLKSRHATFAPVSQLAAEKTDGIARGDSKAAGKGSEVDPRFDGTGWLLPVHSTKRSAPPYALLDEEGNILKFVSPAPGLNLNRYLRKEVGIFGQKQQTESLDKPHLTAHRVVELERHRR